MNNELPRTVPWGTPIGINDMIWIEILASHYLGAYNLINMNQTRLSIPNV